MKVFANINRSGKGSASGGSANPAMIPSQPESSPSSNFTAFIMNGYGELISPSDLKGMTSTMRMEVSVLLFDRSAPISGSAWDATYLVANSVSEPFSAQDSTWITAMGLQWPGYPGSPGHFYDVQNHKFLDPPNVLNDEFVLIPNFQVTHAVTSGVVHSKWTPSFDMAAEGYVMGTINVQDVQQPMMALRTPKASIYVDDAWMRGPMGPCKFMPSSAESDTIGYQMGLPIAVDASGTHLYWPCLHKAAGSNRLDVKFVAPTLSMQVVSRLENLSAVILGPAPQAVFGI